MKSRFLKTLLAAGLGLAALTSIAFAGTVRVTVAEYSAKTRPYFEAAKKAFEAANPGAEIQIEVVPWSELLQKLTTDINAGTNADISIIATRWLIDFVKQDVAEPIDGLMTPEFKGRFIEALLTPSIIDGKTYGLPVAASARALYYNKELFEKAGITEPPKTWDDLKVAAEKSQPWAASMASVSRARISRPTSIIIMRCGRKALKSSTRTASRVWRATGPSRPPGSTRT